MEIFMRGVSWNVDLEQVKAHLTTFLHADYFERLHPTRMNFHVYLHPDKKKLHRHGGTGVLTLPNEETATHFLELFGTAHPQIQIALDRKVIVFSKSNKQQPRRDVLEKIMLPYMDPWVVEERERRVQQLTQGKVRINILQFGWECRDYVYSVECERDCHNSAVLSFSEDRRELQIEFQHEGEIYIIAMTYSHIREITVHNYLNQDPVILFMLHMPPTYMRKQQPTCERLSFLPIAGHERVAPYASLAIRLVCTSPGELEEFRRLSRVAQLHKVMDYEYPVDSRNIFSAVAFQRLEQYLRNFHWCISFQITALLRSLVVDVQEILELIPDIVEIFSTRGKEFTAALLRKFASRPELAMYTTEEAEVVNERTLSQCLRETEHNLLRNPTLSVPKPSEGSLFDAFRITITPTTMILEGPFPERSNRVIRAYDPRHHESFLRVSFLDESKLQYRFDRDIDGPGFIRARVGPFLLDKLTIAGRSFRFLAYSQSALKEHAVWFVKRFNDNHGNLVTADSIIKSLGDFEKLDRNLIYCPARYAARLSQAFTATDAVEVTVEEILPIEDICTADGKYQFTDGVGTMSKELSREIYAQLKKTKRRRRMQDNLAPSAYQIRLGGSKGMISVDYKLRGMTICTRPSMTKFDGSDWNTIEIARAFDRPGQYFLNRPLIMLLEGLGVRYEVFEYYQNNAVLETNGARVSLGAAASGLFDRYGLGTSFRLSSVLLNLEKLGIDDLPGSPFYSKMLDYSINHVLRDLKNHARIPVPGAWTLVGVADVHRYLLPNQIFACVKPASGRTIYLQGPVLISRSPTIHPGDAMIVEAIGRPPPGSCFHAEPIPNTVVFSVQGDRPTPSCLGGGDLDGDVYNLIPLNDLPEFRPTKSHMPANYDPAPRKILDRPSTMADVADFVMEYINSDVVGIIAINWLLIADQSSEHIFNEKCMKLADLHSNAVDYPKSGQPVALSEIPKPGNRSKPDWHAPETVGTSTGDFYESSRAIGRLFRAIDLPVEQEGREAHRHRRGPPGRRRQTAVNDLGERLRNVNIGNRGDDPVFIAVEDRVLDYIDTDRLTEVININDLFDEYAIQLQAICLSHTLSHARMAQLSEEEATVGTIVQKTSQRRKRKDMMAALRESTDVLVRSIREELAGEDGVTNEQYLERSWIAWDFAREKSQLKKFGGESFAWLALGAIFDAIREIDEEGSRK